MEEKMKWVRPFERCKCHLGGLNMKFECALYNFLLKWTVNLSRCFFRDLCRVMLLNLSLQTVQYVPLPNPKLGDYIWFQWHSVPFGATLSIFNGGQKRAPF